MTKRHPLETELNADAWDILNAVRSGFRALVDVKGKLAEYFFEKRLAEMKTNGVIERYEWKDVDGEPDFEIVYHGRELRVECKNVRSSEVYKKPSTAGTCAASSNTAIARKSDPPDTSSHRSSRIEVGRYHRTCSSSGTTTQPDHT